MKIEILPFDQVPQFSNRDKAYALEDERLKPFYKYRADITEFERVIKDKKSDPVNRKVLVETLKSQYEILNVSSATMANIEKLADTNTFTVTTAHQPSLFTGPLYYIYKIISTINLSRTLNEEYADFQFVPIFITGGEDHDFEEANHFQLFGKRVEWTNEEGGPVGMMSTDSLQIVLEQTKEVLGDTPYAKELSTLLESSVNNKNNYSEVTRYLTNELFKEDGLVILDTNDKRLKQLFIPYIEKEVLEQPSKPLVEATVKQLEKAGFSEQAYPREINFFYLQPGKRSRIVEENGEFRVLDTDITFSAASIKEEIYQHPERFSPNVVMRPIYQELVLPNLAYIGGGGELAYWLERKSQFDQFGLNYPMLIRRNSVLFIDKGTQKRLDKIGLSIHQLFGDIEALIKEYVQEHTENELSLLTEKEQLQAIFSAIEEKAGKIDPTLIKATAAEGARQLNSLQQLEGKLMRAEKQRHDTAINQVRKLKDKLFPGNGLQERSDNFMSLYLKYGKAFFDILKDHLHPLKKGFVIISDQ